MLCQTDYYDSFGLLLCWFILLKACEDKRYASTMIWQLFGHMPWPLGYNREVTPSLQYTLSMEPTTSMESILSASMAVQS